MPPQIKDPRTFASLYEAHSNGVYATAYRILGRVAEAEDVVQEVFLRLWCEPERFDPARGEVGSYLRVMARSRALDLWRHEQAGGRAQERLKVVAADEELDADERPVAAAERSQERATVRAALRLLPEPQREAIVLSYWGGLAAEDVARRTEVPFGTARSRMRLGLAKLRAACAAEAG